MSKPYEAILFDFDGVLVDSEPVHWECWTQILTPFGINLEWDHYSRNCIGISDRQMVSFLCSQVDPPADFETVYAEYPRKKAMFRERMLNADAIGESVRDMVASLRRDFLTAVVTSSGKTEVHPLLEKAGLLPLLDTCVFGDDVRALKPAPDPYLLAASRLGIGRALVVEDSDAGETAGRAAGFDVLRIRSQAELLPRLKTVLEQNGYEPRQTQAEKA